MGAIEPQFHALLLEKLGLDPAEFAAGVGFSGRPYDELVDEIWPPLKARLAAAIRRHTRDELQSMFEGTDACVTPVLDIHEAAAHPHLRARRGFVDVDGHLQNAPAPRFSRTPLPVAARGGCRGAGWRGRAPRGRDRRGGDRGAAALRCARLSSAPSS